MKIQIRSFKPENPLSEENKVIQAGALDLANNGGHMVMSALAGTGKTTMFSILAHSVIPPNSNCLFTSFTNAIVDAARPKMPSFVQVNGMHKEGLAACRKSLGSVRVNKWKVSNLIEKETGYSLRPGKLPKQENERIKVIQLFNAVKSGVDLCRMCRTDYSDLGLIEGTLDLYGVTVPEWDEGDPLELIQIVIEEGYRTTSEVDFVDMICMPVELDLPMDNRDFVMVDECQDLGAAMVALSKKMTGENGCAWFCGDEYQAIYGFNGARVDCVKYIKDEFQAIEYPLRTNYRCGKLIIKEAQKIVPDIKAWDQSPDGEVLHLSNKQIMDRAKVGNMLLDRKNAPAIGYFFYLVEQGKPAAIKGKGVQEQIDGLIKGFKTNDLLELGEKAEEFRAKEEERIKRRGKGVEEKLELLDQKFGTLNSLVKGVFKTGGRTVEDLKNNIKKIFVEKFNGKTIQIMTAHTSKGLEGDEVFIMNSNKFRISRPDMQDWQHQQEANLDYVARTRAKKVLGYGISDADDGFDAPEMAEAMEREKKAEKARSTNPFLAMKK